MTSSPHGLYKLGYRRATIKTTILKSFFSTNYFLKFENIKSESQVIAKKYVAVNKP
jgi:hypothetical protein